jgi:Fe-S-cluster containining protein
MSEAIHDPKPVTPIEPVQLGPDDRLQFRCHKAIPCFNKCCENIDIMLTPYDVLRLKARLGTTAREFIDRYTRDYQMDSHGMPGLKLATREGSRACVFLRPEGCSVYEDRPSACRYYPIGLLTMRKKDSPSDEASYFLVKEDHCLGHFESKTQTLREYRAEQGVDEYDAQNREWHQIILKKRSAGPAIGRPSQRSFELFFLASYDVDGFRAFVTSPGFDEVFDLDPAEKAALVADDAALQRFGFRLLKQVLFGERTIPLKREAVERRAARIREKAAAEAESKAERWSREQDEFYASLGDTPGEE